MEWRILGHDWAVELLAGHVARGQARQAYLFTGPQGVGRRTLALRLAQALNCPQPPEPGQPCLQCLTCSQIERMQHPDLAVVQSEQVGGTLKVEQVRELQRSLTLHPYVAKVRFALLLRFEEAHPSAMNALLKTLEEPAPRVVLAITAESPESLLPTVVSRCEVLRLRPVRLEELSLGLQEILGLPAEQAQILAHISAGRPGVAINLSRHPELAELRQAWLDQHDQLLSAGRAERFNFAERLAKDKEAFRLLALYWLSYWRDVLHKASGAATPLANLDRLERIHRLAERSGSPTASRIVACLERTLDLLEKNVNPRLLAEVLMLDLPRL